MKRTLGLSGLIAEPKQCEQVITDGEQGLLSVMTGMGGDGSRPDNQSQEGTWRCDKSCSGHALQVELHCGILERFPSAILNGHPTERLPNTLNLSFPEVNAGEL